MSPTMYETAVGLTIIDQQTAPYLHLAVPYRPKAITCTNTVLTICFTKGWCPYNHVCEGCKILNKWPYRTSPSVTYETKQSQSAHAINIILTNLAVRRNLSVVVHIIQ